LKNGKYERIEELNADIKEFQQFFLNDGPLGPLRELICQEFCYSKIAEGAEYFVRKYQTEIGFQQ